MCRDRQMAADLPLKGSELYHMHRKIIDSDDLPCFFRGNP